MNEERPETPEPAAMLAGKKVLYGISNSNGGGAETYVLMIAKGARNASAEVQVLAGGADYDSGAPDLLITELEREHISSTTLLDVPLTLTPGAMWKAIKELREMISQEKPDVLHLNSIKMGLLGGIAGRLSGVKHIVFTAHGWPHKEQRPLIWKLMAWTGSWLTLVCAHKVICVSESDLRDSPTILFRDHLALVRNGVNDFQHKSREEARAALMQRAPDLKKYSHWLLMNAELHPNKGISTAIRALAELAPRHPELALVVCGEGDDREQLAELARQLNISSRVFLLGFVPHTRENLLAGDIFLLPSRKEGLPLALLEAGLSGLPVIASKVGGIPEVITEKVTGLFMPRSNTHILASSIMYLLNTPEDAKKYGVNLRQKVLTDFSESRMVQETLALY